MKKILVAVDGSDYSQKAYEYALDEAEVLDNELTVLKVVNTYETSFEEAGEVLKKEIEKARDFTKELKKRGEEKGIEVNADIVMSSSIANEIVKYADENDFDLIVIGSRGKTDLETIHLGSVSEGVVKRAHAPVLVVRDYND